MKQPHTLKVELFDVFEFRQVGPLSNEIESSSGSMVG
jgi:hypothetical protein